MLLRLPIFIVFVNSVLYASCEGIKKRSLTFAIDDTRSMGDDIKQVLKEIDKIMDMVLQKSSVIDDMVLVTFNDPDVRLKKKTRNRYHFKRALNSIRVKNFNNYDCPEYSLSGIEMALNESRPGSYIYVFTDASAKDYKKVNKIKDLCQKTQSKVVFVLTGNCRRPNSVEYKVYHDIAIASSGLVIEVDKHEVNLVVKTISTFIEGNTNPVRSIEVEPNVVTHVPFTVDDKTDYIIISVSGKDIQMQVKGPGADPKKIMWTKNSKMVQLIKPEPGNYTVDLISTTTAHVAVYARTNFTFQHGFSETKPKTISDTSRKPIASKETRLSILVEDPSDSVEINTAQILNMSEEPIGDPLPLREIGDNFYITDSFISPETAFKLAVNGHFIDSGKPIRSLAQTPIDPQIVETAVNTKPTVIISEGDTTTAILGNPMVLTCKVHAYPAPEIIWSDQYENKIPTNMTTQEPPYNYISYLKLTSVTKTNKYYCNAINKFGHDKKSINIEIGDPFKVVSHPAEKTRIKYGESASLKCDITSDFKMKINWYYNDGYSTHKLHTSSIYNISSDGTALAITSMKKELEGTYTCNAALLSDDYIHKKFTTHVEMYGLEKPKVKQLSNVLKVMNNSSAVIKCGILEGHPKPTITWQFQGRGSHIFIPMTETSEVLRISNAYPANSGNYRCVAENVLGQDMASTELLVETAPKVAIDEGKNITLPYGADLLLTCAVEAFPPPKIVWSEKRGIPVLTKTPSESIDHIYKYGIKISKMKKSDNFSCYASNYLGESLENIDVTVESPFEVEEKPKEKVNVDYGKSHTIKCHIKSPLNMKIQWYRIPEVKGMKRLIIPSDKVSISPNATELTIGFMEPNLDGVYGCTASLVDYDDEKITYVTKIKTTGLAQPEIDKSTTIMKVKSKSSATIPCRILKGNPKPNIEWYIRDDPSIEPVYLNKTGEVLEITEVTVKNTVNPKLYLLCVAKNMRGQDQHQTEIIVEAPPKILNNKEKTEYTAIVGDVVLRIPCNVTGYPKPTISWKVNGHDITTDSKYSIVDGALIVRTPGENDTLEYTCVAKNSLGEDSVTFDGIVTTGIYEYDNVYHVNVLEESSKKIICFLTYSGTDKLRWFLDTEPLNNTESYIYLKDASESMDGNYSCRVSNENGNRMDTYVVEVGYPPSFTSYQDETIDWEGIGSLDCDVNAKPNVTAQWFYEGKPMKTNKNILQLPITKWGHFRCKISNPHGSVSRSFNVISSACLINRRGESDDTSPLLLTENLKWPQYLTNTDYLVIPYQEKLILSCNNGDDLSNTFKVMPNKTKIEIACASKDAFWIDGKIYKYPDLRCTHKVMPVVKRTGQECLNVDTEMVQVGYQLDEFVTVYSACLDTKKNVPLYSQLNMIDTNDINIPTVSDWFKSSEMKFENNDVYTCENSSHSCCIGKEQLVNVNDVNFGPAKRSTFIENINSIPVWRNCDMSRMSWRRLEDRIREQYVTNPQFAVWTGASDYIKTDKRNVPQYLWKVVRFDELDSLAIIYVNDPHPKDSQVLCKNVCAPDVPSWVNSRDKYTYCCELTDFLTAFNIPEEAIGGI